MTSREKASVGFNERAMSYDSWYSTPFGRYAHELEKRAVFSSIQDQRVQEVLDVGCGTGNYLIHLAARDFSVVGLDSSIAMIRVAKKKVRESGIDVDLVVGQAENLPFKERAFGLVISILALCFIGDEAKAISEMKRVSRRQCTMVVATLNRWSLYSIDRKLRAKIKNSVYRKAHFHSIIDLKALLGEVGEWSSTLFAQPWMPVGLLSIFNWVEGPLSKILKPMGAFIVILIRKQG